MLFVNVQKNGVQQPEAKSCEVVVRIQLQVWSVSEGECCGQQQAVLCFQNKNGGWTGFWVKARSSCKPHLFKRKIGVSSTNQNSNTSHLQTSFSTENIKYYNKKEAVFRRSVCAHDT